MENQGIDKQVTLHLPIGHLLVVWAVLSNKLSETPCKDELTDEERRAIWALQDLCENELARNGYGEMPEDDWNNVMKRATVFVKTIPVEFLD